MKPCPLCHAAVYDDITFTPGETFCGACGRNAVQVQQAPTLPAGAMAFPAAAPQPPIVGNTPPSPQGYGAGAPPPGYGTPGPQLGAPYGAPPAAGPQIGTPYGAPPSQPAPGPQIGSPPGGWQSPPPQPGYPPPGAPLTAAPPGLNWGAFLIPFAWGPANKVWIGLVSLVAFLPYVGINLGGLGVLIWLAISIYLLIKGNELAWRSGRAWQSQAEFVAEQKKWVTYGLIALAVEVVLGFMMGGALLLGGGAPPVRTPGF